MEQKAKRVGKFNIIDIIAVILIVAVVAFGAWKLLGSSGGTAAEDGGMVKVTYVVKCEGVPTELYETCQAHLPSPLMASGALVGGQIERVEMEPYYVLGPDGQWLWWAARLSAWRWSPTTCWAPMGSGSRIRSM